MYTDPIRAIRAVLVEITNDDALTTGSDGTKLCLTYAETLSKQLNGPTVQDMVFAEWLIKGLKKCYGEQRQNQVVEEILCIG